MLLIFPLAVVQLRTFTILLHRANLFPPTLYATTAGAFNFETEFFSVVFICAYTTNTYKL